MKISQVQLWIQNNKLPEAFSWQLDHINGDHCRVVLTRELAEPKEVQSIDDLLSKLDNKHEMVWRGWTFEPDFMWEFQKTLEHYAIK